MNPSPLRSAECPTNRKLATAEYRLDGITMRPAELDVHSALSAETTFRFCEDGAVVWADYEGGPVARGFLAGVRIGDDVRFRYLQVSREGRVDGGESRCEISSDARGMPCLTEHFSWATRQGAGRNVFVAVD